MRYEDIAVFELRKEFLGSEASTKTVFLPKKDSFDFKRDNHMVITGKH